MSDPEAMEQIKSLGQMLGINQEEAEPKDESVINADTMGKLTQLMPIINNARGEDDTTRLLAALKPFLSEARRKRLDSARRIIMMLKLIPALKEVGLFEMFGG
jgi:hypothetical protein